MSYTYNSDGIRTGKTVGGTATKYLVDGSTVIAQQTGSDVLWFMYESDGNRVGFTYNGTAYYYTKNAQGDVTGIVDSNCNTVVEYSYDAWGKLLSTTGSLAGTIGKVNPFLYRGYYYDSETGLYYLNSRYYDPQTGRFISEDGQLNPKTGLAGNNLFAYCNNDPVIMIDTDGNMVALDAGGGGGSWNENYAASTKVNTNDDYDSWLDKNNNDKGSSSYKKEREKKQIDSAFGSDRAKREKDSKDLHDSKKGDKNDHNKSYGDLKSGNFWIQPLKGGSMIIAGAVASGLLVADDATGLGAADDVLIPGAGAMISKGILLIFG
jgi:RHS repeat-associated core domain